MTFPVRGGSAVSPTGMVHLVDVVDSRGSFATSCGVEVAPWSGWGRLAKPLEEYPHCSRCSLFGPVPKNWAELEVNHVR